MPARVTWVVRYLQLRAVLLPRGQVSVRFYQSVLLLGAAGELTPPAADQIMHPRIYLSLHSFQRFLLVHGMSSILFFTVGGVTS